MSRAGFVGLIATGRMMCCDLLVGPWVWVIPLVVMFVRCSIRLTGDQDSLVEYKRF